MKTIRQNKYGILVLIAAMCLVGAAVTRAQLQEDAPSASAATARELSNVFREVSREALPSMVSIVTEGKAVRLTGGDTPFPFDEDSPFGELFKNDPRFRDFFRNRPERPERELPRSRGQGSGFVIDRSGIIMTNTHVVRDAEKVIVRLHDGREFQATDIKTDPRSDVAILKIDAPNGLKAVRMGDSDQMEIGDWVLAVGSPFGLDLTVTAGIISAKGRGPGIAEREDFLQTDAAINPGNSGGPLLNINGEVIGINTAISSRTGANAGVGFAIPINMAQWVGRQLMERGKVERAYLGVSIQPLTSNLAEHFGAEYGHGVVVAQVTPKSPAADADLQSGDVILELAGRKVDSPRTLQGIVERLDIGKAYDMQILRDGKRESLSITFRQMPDDFTRANLLGRRDTPNEPEKPEETGFDKLGLEVKELTPNLARQLGFANVSGVVVGSVERDSAAARAGLAPGIVIEKVGRKAVASPEEYREAIEGVSLEDGVVLLVRTTTGSSFVVVSAD
jgi:serine protease Do